MRKIAAANTCACTEGRPTRLLSVQCRVTKFVPIATHTRQRITKSVLTVVLSLLHNHPCRLPSLPHHLPTTQQLLDSHVHMLTNAIGSEGYAETKKGFERAAEERARAFRSLTDAQDRTKESVEVSQGPAASKHLNNTPCPFPHRTRPNATQRHQAPPNTATLYHTTPLAVSIPITSSPTPSAAAPFPGAGAPALRHGRSGGCD